MPLADGRELEPPGPAREELLLALSVLEQVAADWGLLALLDREARVRLEKAAGEIARPGKEEQRRLRRALARTEHRARKARELELRSATGIQTLRRQEVYRLPPPRPPSEGEERTPEGQELPGPRKCYVCKAAYRRLHPFYDQLCPRCGDENQARRAATVDLFGRVALVTGARVKIGYQAALMLLRAGCRVVSLTRFPRDAATRYAREPDFPAFRDRLSIYGCDLRHTPSVERLCRHLDEVLPRLDFQIHNACQTVRRPPGFYAHLSRAEEAPNSARPPEERGLLLGWEALRRSPDFGAAVREPFRLSQARSSRDPLLPAEEVAEVFPPGLFDADLQQVDWRGKNSWRLFLHEVPTLELLEVLLVNATAPFVMASRLKGLMVRGGPPPLGSATSGDPARHLVMVSAMEGQFYRRHKTDRHPHTNMAKAALNMLVRTSAPIC